MESQIADHQYMENHHLFLDSNSCENIIVPPLCEDSPSNIAFVIDGSTHVTPEEFEMYKNTMFVFRKYNMHDMFFNIELIINCTTA